MKDMNHNERLIKTTKETWDSRSKRAELIPQIKPIEGLHPTAYIMLGSQFEVPFYFIYGDPDLDTLWGWTDEIVPRSLCVLNS
jgi:hypothetical protein